MLLKKVRIKYLLIGILILIIFTGFSKWISGGGMREVDLAFTVKLQEKIDNSSRLRLSRFVGEAMEGSSFLASPSVSVVIIFFLAIVNFLKSKSPARRFVSLSLSLLFVILVAAEIYGKSVVEHPAPPFFLLKNPTTIFPKYHVWEDYSYPSGHAARATFIAVIIYLTIQQCNNVTMWKKKLWTGIVLGLYVALISISRIYLGHHWLSDVLGGWLLGSGFGALLVAIIR